MTLALSSLEVVTSAPAGKPSQFSNSLHRTTSLAMQRLYSQLNRVAQTPATVMISGESGSGKEVIAKTIHEKSPRKEQPFIPVNCGAIPVGLIEAELFGHEKGSYTGALQQQIGYFEHACGGTLFLDDQVIEIPNPNFSGQSKRIAHQDGCVNVTVGTSLADAQREIILATLDHFNGNKNLAANALGISRKTLHNRLAAYQLT